jgi:phosphatidate cytidylyltransferase
MVVLGLNLGEGLAARVAAAAVLMPLALALTWLGGWWFAALVIAAAAVMWFEWHRLVSPGADKFALVAPGALLLVALTSAGMGHSTASLNWISLAAPLTVLTVMMGHGRPVWAVLGVVYIGIAGIAAIWLRGQPDDGFAIVLWLLAVVWATDIGAFFAGRRFGGAKLAPRISPNKTWAGLGGGMAAAGLVGVATAVAIGGSALTLLAVGAGLAVVEQIGDLAESALKRHFGVKDSGTIIPGHGGMLDRLDGMLAVLPAVAAMMLFANGIPGWR